MSATNESASKSAIDKSVPLLPAVAKELRDFINRYVWFPEPHQDVLVTMWILATYVHTACSHFGLLWVYSPIMRCGKSTLLKLVSNLSHNSEGTIRFGTSVAALFRSCNDQTIVLDEYETLSPHHKSELDSILRASYDASGTFVRLVEVTERTSKKSAERDWRPKRYPVFGPKAIGSILEQPGTLRDRCFKVNMVRMPAGIFKPTLNLNNPEHKAQLQNLAEKCKAAVDSLRGKWFEIYSSLLQTPPANFTDHRLKDISLPLLAMAKVAGFEKELVAVLQAQSDQREAEDQELLAELIELFDRFLLLDANSKTEFHRAKELVKHASKDSSLCSAQTLGALLSKHLSKETEIRTLHGYTEYKVNRKIEERLRQQLEGWSGGQVGGLGDPGDPV